MTLTKKTQVVMLYSSNGRYSPIAIDKINNWLYKSNKLTTHYQHLYFLSDDKIKEDDYYIDDTNSIRKSITSDVDYWEVRSDYKKIIATTDTLLSLKCDCEYIKKVNTGLCSGCGRFTNIPLLPQPSQEFVEYYIKNYNKGNQMTEVDVEYLNVYQDDCFIKNEDVLKVNSNNEIITKTHKSALNQVQQLMGITERILGEDNK